MKKGVLVLCCLMGAVLAHAQVPDEVYVAWSDDNFDVHYSAALSGSVGENEGTVVWDVGADHATVTMAGSYAFYGPDFQLRWQMPSDPFPVNIVADTQTTSSYVMRVQWSAAELGSETRTLTEDGDWGILVPGGALVAITFFPDEYMVEHNVTFTVNWGEGTPVEIATLGAIKSLYR